MLFRSLDLIIFGILQGNAKTNWLLIIPVGIIYFLLYYSSFKYLILKYNLKTLGRSNNGKLLLQQDEKNFDVLTASKVIDGFNQQFYYIVKGLGGKNNFKYLDS